MRYFIPIVLILTGCEDDRDYMIRRAKEKGIPVRYSEDSGKHAENRAISDKTGVPLKDVERFRGQ